CRCRPAWLQLLVRGFFPCAPVRPSMAFSIRLLSWFTCMSLHLAPNTTAWAAVLAMFWERHSVRTKHESDLRKRLAASCSWFEVLENRKDAYITTEIDGKCEADR
ncbi:hypothetical protein BKA62DRAFT_620099, partial [Auriculariales sp. MPI-PUGE-AT-0066]